MIKELEELDIVDFSILNTEKYFKSYSHFLHFLEYEYWVKDENIPSQILISAAQYRKVCLWSESDTFICSSCQTPTITKLHTDFGEIRFFRKITL